MDHWKLIKKKNEKFLDNILRDIVIIIIIIRIVIQF